MMPDNQKKHVVIEHWFRKGSGLVFFIIADTMSKHQT
jgi:hypothetical protein